MKEAERLRKIADNIAIKVPLTPDGLKTCKALTRRGDDGQRHLVFLGQPGAARGQGRGKPSFRRSSAGSTISASRGWS